MSITVAGAPVSFGVFELTPDSDDLVLPTADEVCATLQDTGYRGVDSGPIGLLGRGAELRERLARLATPSVTVGVVRHGTPDDGAILLVRHSYLDGWGFPGGLINRREQVDVALLRETREEVVGVIELVGEPAVTLEQAEGAEVLLFDLPP